MVGGKFEKKKTNRKKTVMCCWGGLSFKLHRQRGKRMRKTWVAPVPWWALATQMER